MRFYSQNGEDVILFDLFKDKRDGFFVEIGCMDGCRFSNTLAFEEAGWKGVCVEAHDDYIKGLQKNRPGSIVYHCAIGECDDNDAVFYANHRGALSTLDSSKEEFFKDRFGAFFSGFTEQPVRKRTLTTVFDECDVKAIDILSLDIEGYEIEALHGLDLTRYRPRVMIIESQDDAHEEQVDAILLPNGYYKAIKLNENIFYCASQELKEQILDKKYECTLTHVYHPNDGKGESVVKGIVNTCERRTKLKIVKECGN